MRKAIKFHAAAFLALAAFVNAQDEQDRTDETLKKDATEAVLTLSDATASIRTKPLSQPLLFPWANQSQRRTSAPTRRRQPPSAFSKTGYIENAIVGSQVRVRFDAGFDNIRPDRAEFFYPKCGCFRILGVDPDAPGPAPSLEAGPRIIETGLDFQDLLFTFEYAPHRRFSLLLDLPVRSIDPNINSNETGLSDIRVGFKYALAASESRYITFQFKGYLPTGDGEKGLGTEHASLEPGLVFYQEIAPRVALAGELRYWIPLDGSNTVGVPSQVADDDTDFAGDVVRYGLGISVDATPNSNFHLTPVVEVVAWSVLDGFASATTDGTLDTFSVEDASGDTIVNLKIGARMSIGNSRGSLYIGYGKALTDQTWYDQIFRLEYRFAF